MAFPDWDRFQDAELERFGDRTLIMSTGTSLLQPSQRDTKIMENKDKYAMV